MTNVAITTLSKLRTNPDKFKKHYLDALSMITLIGMCISVVLTLTGKDGLFTFLTIVPVIAGQEFFKLFYALLVQESEFIWH
jgi:hypothetical protein